FGDGTYFEVVRLSAQRAVQLLHQGDARQGSYGPRFFLQVITRLHPLTSASKPRHRQYNDSYDHPQNSSAYNTPNVAANFAFAKFVRSCLLAQPTDRRVKFCLRMHAGAAIEPDANFVLAGGFELGDPPLFFVRHALTELVATLDDAISEAMRWGRS